MKYHIVLLVILTCTCQNTPNPLPSEVAVTQTHVAIHAIERVEVRAVSFGISTWGSITCDKFDKAFTGTDMEFHVLTDKQLLLEVASHLSDLKPTTDKSSLDTRAKAVIFYQDNSIKTLCIDQFTMEYDGKRVKNDNVLLRLLKIKTDY